MKGKKFIIILLVMIATVGAYAFLGMDYLGQQDRQEELGSQLAELKATLGAGDDGPGLDVLEQRLEDAKEKLAAKQRESTISTMKGTAVLDAILRTAQESDVSALPMQTQPVSTTKVSGHKYNVQGLKAKARGSFPDLLAFIDELENGDLETLIVKDLSLGRGGEEVWNANLDMAFYSQSLPQDEANTDSK
ncbi:MAG: hypothetical protein ACOC6S_03250 [Chloroflexota bacterium]